MKHYIPVSLRWDPVLIEPLHKWDWDLLYPSYGTWCLGASCSTWYQILGRESVRHSRFISWFKIQYTKVILAWLLLVPELNCDRTFQLMLDDSLVSERFQHVQYDEYKFTGSGNCYYLSTCEISTGYVASLNPLKTKIMAGPLWTVSSILTELKVSWDVHTKYQWRNWSSMYIY